jgi:hypothetical protein
MKYLLTFIVDERQMVDSSPEEMRDALERWSAFDREAADAGVLIACEPVEASSATTTLRLQGDEHPIVTDGPFAESKEQLGGFCLLECAGKDEALEWAHKVPMKSGSIEVRPIMDLAELGYESKTLSPARASA